MQAIWARVVKSLKKVKHKVFFEDFDGIWVNFEFHENFHPLIWVSLWFANIFSFLHELLKRQTKILILAAHTTLFVIIIISAGSCASLFVLRSLVSRFTSSFFVSFIAHDITYQVLDRVSCFLHRFGVTLFFLLFFSYINGIWWIVYSLDGLINICQLLEIHEWLRQKLNRKLFWLVSDIIVKYNLGLLFVSSDYL